MAGTSNPVTELDVLSRAELGARFEGLFKRPVPKGMSRPLLLRIITYRTQEDLAGGPDRALEQRLARLAEDRRKGRMITPRPILQIKPGTRLLRDWQGETHTVTVSEAGFQYKGKAYRSLSAIARAITGTRWSGPAFFGLRDRKKPIEGTHAL